MAHHEVLANQRACSHHDYQHHPVVLARVGKAVVVAQHGKQHGQREVGVVHAALLAALAMDRVNGFACVHRCHHLALARNNPEKHVGTHGCAYHGANQQECRASSKQLGRQPGCKHNGDKYEQTNPFVTTVFGAYCSTQGIVNKPKTN